MSIVLGIANNMRISSACLIAEGKIIAAAAEERFTRQKMTRVFPENAIKYCLKSADLSMNDVDAICISADPGIDLSIRDYRYSGITRWYPESIYSVPNNLATLLSHPYVGPTSQIFRLNNEKQIEIFYYNHHLCHAANGFYLSPFDDCAILTVDGRGENETALFGVGTNGKINVEATIPVPHSLGLFYATFTQMLGFRPDCDEWKVMGLAAYGQKNNQYYNILRNLIKLNDDGTFELDLNHFRYYISPNKAFYAESIAGLLNAPKNHDKTISEWHHNVASAVQQVTEEVLVHMLCHLHRRTQKKYVVLSGGVFMNSVFNGKVLDKTPFKDYYISSCPDDSGTSLGAALWHSFSTKKDICRTICDQNYWGPSFTDEEIAEEIKRYKVKSKYIKEIEPYVAKIISDGAIIGWFQGKMEFGQRALGNRSILADPRRPDMKDLLNSAVKYRESFRPFAPAVLAEDFITYFPELDPSHAYFMSVTTKICEAIREQIPAVVHIDGSARPQAVFSNVSPRFHRLITEFKLITGIPVLLNTSFNLNDEPIVCTPRDALRTFFSSGLDVLVMGNLIVEKN